MTRRKILVDNGFLFLLQQPGHPQYAAAQSVMQTEAAEFIVPNVTLTEAAYLFNRSGGMPSVATFLEVMAESRFSFILVEPGDLKRAAQIMRTYLPTKLDFVDCCLVALAERLNIRQICTVDRRDFSIIRTQSGEFLEILP